MFFNKVLYILEESKHMVAYKSHNMLKQQVAAENAKPSLPEP